MKRIFYALYCIVVVASSSLASCAAERRDWASGPSARSWGTGVGGYTGAGGGHK